MWKEDVPASADRAWVGGGPVGGNGGGRARRRARRAAGATGGGPLAAPRGAAPHARQRPRQAGPFRHAGAKKPGGTNDGRRRLPRPPAHAHTGGWPTRVSPTAAPAV